MKDDIAILLIGHGSRLPYNKKTVNLHADMLRVRGFKVYVAFNEMTEPSVEETMMLIEKDGFREVVALPIFVASGQHTERDITMKMGLPEGYGTNATTKYGNILVHYEEPFGEDPAVTQVLIEKIMDLEYDKDNTGIMIIAHGSPRKHNSDLVKLTVDRIVERGFENTFLGFNEYNDPKIEETYNKILGSGFSKIIVVPLFLASGAHLEEEIPEKLGIPVGSRGGIVTYLEREVDIKYAEPFGMDPRMNDILQKKISKYL